MNEPTTTQEMMEALLLVLLDKKTLTEALFIHGSSVRNDHLDYKILSIALDDLEHSFTTQIVINGITDEECRRKNLAYVGADTWLAKLSPLAAGLGGSFGGRTRQTEILTIQASPHTPAESDNLITLALERGWQKITILALPHHILRCMLQIVFLMKRRDIFLKVYARTLSVFDGVDWNMNADKPVLGGGTVSGSFFDHIAAEYERIEKYKDKDGTGYTPNATIPELIKYIRARDRE